MTTRKADFVIYTPSHEGFKDLGYVDEVEAICVLNKVVLVFTVRKMNRIFRKSNYRLRIELPSVLTGRIYGIAYYDTMEEALKIGTEFVKQRFPVVEAEDLLEN
jgi:hypothetical protein